MAIWNTLLRLWIRLGLHFLPPLVHPMLVHFPIVLLYGSLFSAIVGLFWRDRFFDRASFWLLVLGLVAGIAAAAAGVISEQYVRWTPATSALLSRHQADAVLTGLFVILALVSRVLARYPNGPIDSRWSVARTGRGKPTIFSLVFLVGAVVMVTLTASVGGTMVYQYGVGIHGVLFRTPPQLTGHS